MKTECWDCQNYEEIWNWSPTSCHPENIVFVFFYKKPLRRHYFCLPVSHSRFTAANNGLHGVTGIVELPSLTGTRNFQTFAPLLTLWWEWGSFCLITWFIFNVLLLPSDFLPISMSYLVLTGKLQKFIQIPHWHCRAASRMMYSPVAFTLSCKKTFMCWTAWLKRKDSYE